jgi:hypothetical protein
VIDHGSAICSGVSGRGRPFCKILPSPSGPGATVGFMLIAQLICSDEDCAAETDVIVPNPTALDVAACDCGCTLVVLSVSDWSPAATRALALA